MSNEEPTFRAGESQPQAEEIILPPGTPADVTIEALRVSKQVALAGLVIGFVIVLAGVVVLLLGVSSAVSWKVSGSWGSSELQTGATGVVVAIIGLGVVFISRLNIGVAKAPKP